jgi:hypothetical protein
MARGTFARVRIGIVGFAVASLVGGCSVVASLLPSPLIPPGAPRPIGVEVANGTTLRITIVVDGVAVADIGPGDGTQAPIVADVLGPMPWHVEARTPSGRVLLTLTVNDGDVFYGQNTTRGDAARIDLSCGRLDVWVGPPLIGPMPGPGVAGDCVP